jgi:hypothetical protein
MANWIDFKEVSAKVSFKQLLDHLGIIYEETDTEIKTEKIVVNKTKNLFFYKGSKEGGNVINFTAKHLDTDLRTAALMLQKTFLQAPPEPKRGLPEYELKYHPFLQDNGIPPEVCTLYEVGYVSKGIMSGKIGFKVYQDSLYVGYIGKELKKEGYFYPNGFKASDCVYNLDKVDIPDCYLCSSPLDALILISRGFKNTLALFTKTATDRQLEKLQNFNRIVIFNCVGENVAARLSQKCFVKLVKTPVKDLTDEEIKALF